MDQVLVRLCRCQVGDVSVPSPDHGAIAVIWEAVDTGSTPQQRTSRHCAWCGQRLPAGASLGRRRMYCAPSCRQRAYERRSAIERGGLPEDAVVLSSDELARLQDRLFQLRCAAEDIATAVADGADDHEIGRLAQDLLVHSSGLERLR